MKRSHISLTLLLSVLLVSGFFAATTAVDMMTMKPGITPGEELGVMPMDADDVTDWIARQSDALKTADRHVSAGTIPMSGEFDLLDNLSYIPAERSQGSCGNCWLWASTGVMELDLFNQYGIKDRLSIQYVNSCIDRQYACCGGSLEEFVATYLSLGKAIPWTNTNAFYQDNKSRCENDSSSVSCAAISAEPGYPVSFLINHFIRTQLTDKSRAIANIKNILHQNKGVSFSFIIPNKFFSSEFRSFWHGDPEEIWSFDPYRSEPMILDELSGHAVLIVGYNDLDPDPNNHYWLVLNSWGTASGNRPDGCFRLNMNMDYDIYFSFSGVPVPAILFETLNITWAMNMIWEDVYTDLFDESADLELMRRFRDEIMTGMDGGERIVHDLYKHSDDALNLLLNNPELIIEAKQLIHENRDSLVKVLAGKESTVCDFEPIVRFLTICRDLAPVGLQGVIQDTISQIKHAEKSGKKFLCFYPG